MSDSRRTKTAVGSCATATPAPPSLERAERANNTAKWSGNSDARMTATHNARNVELRLAEVGTNLALQHGALARSPGTRATETRTVGGALQHRLVEVEVDACNVLAIPAKRGITGRVDAGHRGRNLRRKANHSPGRPRHGESTIGNEEPMA